MARYSGAVSLSCVSTKKPQEVFTEVLQAIKTSGLKCYKVRHMTRDRLAPSV